MEQSKIIQLYSDIGIVAKVSRETGLHHTAITRILKENNIPITRKHHTINKQFLLTDSPAKYYFFGFALGDGNLYLRKNQATFTITLKGEDYPTLEKFCNYLQYPITRIRNGVAKHQNGESPIVSLGITNQLWKTDFSQLGLVPQKSHNPSALSVPNQFIKPFLLGFIDADGTIQYKNKQQRKSGINTFSRFSLVGHPYNIDWVRNNLISLGFDQPIGEYVEKSGWKRIYLSSAKNLMKLGKCLEIETYYSLCLERKWYDLYHATHY